MATDTKDEYLALETSKGAVKIRLRADLAPNHVSQIKRLCEDKFYDGLIFHRVIDGFMAQTGCPDGTGTGGCGKNLKAEFSDESHKRGTCSMARAGSPDSASSQFFICFEEAPWLNRQYSVWGEVVAGMENVDQLERGEPVAEPDKIISMRVV